MTVSLADTILRFRVWQKGLPIQGFDQNMWRSDAYGFTMRWSDYGNRNSEFGWEFDHIIPSSIIPLDGIGNLRPLNWRTNSLRQAGRF